MRKQANCTSSTGPTHHPEPSPWSILGCILDMLRNRQRCQWIYHLMKELNSYMACIRFGNTDVIPMISSKIARELLKKHDAMFS